jgi:acetylornithine deacetylase/succinyl-diaminopimelate desuccinylase family protein
MSGTTPASEPAAPAGDAAAVGAAVDAVLDARRDELTALVADLVAIDSQIPPHADERAVVAFLRERMEALGLGRGETVAAVPERPNLLTRVPGSGGGPTLMLNGHLDTKPVGDALPQWNTDPLRPELRDGRLYGLGTSDMKAAVAAMVFAAAALRQSGVRLGGDLLLAFAADEEAGAVFGSKHLAPLLRGVDACLIGEPSGWERDWQGLHLVSRGVCCFRIRVRGTQMHSSLSDRMPSVNASRRMADLLVSIEDELELEFTPHALGGVRPTLNVGVMVEGGVYFGVVPGLAEFSCDLRTLPGMTEAGVRAAVDRWLEGRRASDPQLDVEVTFEPGLTWVPPSEIAPEHPLVGATQAAAAEVLGSAPPLSVFPGGTDAPWYAAAGIPTIPSFGPGILTNCHGPNEYVGVESVHQAARIYARVAARFCGVASTDQREQESNAA